MTKTLIPDEMIEQAARIIDPHAFVPRDPPMSEPVQARRQAAARHKATEILNGTIARQAELVEALADAHRQLRTLLRGGRHGPAKGGPVRVRGLAAGDAERLIEMAEEFARNVIARPWINQCVVAREVGARALGISVNDLLSEDRCSELVRKRHKIIAFTHVMTGTNTSQVGRYFGRDHSAVAYACRKYEANVRRLLDA